MITSENCVQLCANCPKRAWEGTSTFEPVTGDLIDRRAHYMNARLEFVRDPAETPDVPTQEIGTTFVDTDGNRTTAFMAGVQLQDIAACNAPVIASRSGFLRRKKHYDCGAEAVKLVAFREETKNTLIKKRQ